jgi:hypothetical protein
MDPTVLFAQTDVVVEIGIDSGSHDSLPKGLLVQRRGAGANHYPVHAALANVLFDQSLSGV